MTGDWVIGRGLLGGAIAASRPRAFGARIRWSEPEAAVADLRAGLDAFLGRVGDAQWTVYWCAGAGVTSTSAAVLEQEVETFQRFLAAIGELPVDVRERGSVYLASSVGGAYAGNPHPPFTEQSATAPLSDYGRAKLRMEEGVRALSADAGVRSLVARITNLYGPGQDLAKGQGLISVIARAYLTRVPVSIFVPLDTIRDYLFVDDCARVSLAAMRRLAEAAPGTSVTKILGAANAVSIGALLGEFSRVRRRRPLVVLGGGDSRGQALDLRVRSRVWTDLDALADTTLPAGIAATVTALHGASVAEAG